MTVLSSRTIMLPQPQSNDVLWIQAAVGNMTKSSMVKYFSSLRAELQQVFPNIKIVIMPNTVTPIVISAP